MTLCVTGKQTFVMFAIEILSHWSYLNFTYIYNNIYTLFDLNVTLMTGKFYTLFPFSVFLFIIFSFFWVVLTSGSPQTQHLHPLSVPGPAINHVFPLALHALPPICQHLMRCTTSCNSLCTKSTCFKQLSFLTHWSLAQLRSPWGGLTRRSK